MAGISRVVIRTREYLSAMFVRGDVLMVMLLRFPQEIRATAGLEIPASDDKKWTPVKKELDLAVRLIKEMSAADGFTLHEPLKPPVEWIAPEPQLIPKALLRRLIKKNL